MPFKKSDSSEEEKILKDLIENSEEAREAHELFEAEYQFRKMLIEARKKENITQKQLSNITGLTQQMISKVETGESNTTMETLMKYLKGIGYGLNIYKL
ncbi:MAG: helix-turn-helix transcriptional regulator [Erysipelotrichaceae bacterium]|nr:helix-turn-helix transcriptional regulator [Erysipelotrichaceae bacterium]